MAFTEKERELIEAIRNFKASKGRMEHKEEFLMYIYKMVDELLGED